MRTRYGPGALALILVALAGIIKLAEPLGGDQSLFLIGAHALHDGAVLYRDFWDLKQPGIYAFYFAATALGPYGALTIHTFELAYLMAFSLVLTVVLRASHTFARVAVAAPLTAVAYYYLAVGSFEAIQVESLVGFPLFCTLAAFILGFRARESGPRRVYFFLGGAAAAIVLAFKIIFVPIVAAFWFVALIDAHRREGLTTRQLIEATTATAGGVAFPTIAILAFFFARGALATALQTWFVLPPRIVKSVPHETAAMLASGIRWFVHRFAGMLVLAAVGAIVALRREADAFALGAFAWIACGVLVILLQVTSWFQYQWLLLAVPIGLLAVLGARALFDIARAPIATPVPRILASSVLFLGAVLFPATLIASDIAPLARHGFALSATSRELYRDAVSTVYAALRADARFVAPNHGSLYVIGDPTFYVVANRLQPVALNGSSVRLFLPEQWVTLEDELTTARPTYLYLSHGVTISSRALTETIAHRYRILHRGNLGDLYVAT